MLGVAVINVLPSGAHAFNFGGVGEAAEQSGFEFFGSGARQHPSDIHIGITSAGETKINDADHFVVLVEQDITKVKIAVDEAIFFGVFDKFMIAVDMGGVVFII